MKLKNLKVKLIKLPVDIEMILFFIKEDLKSQRFFEALNKVGFDSSVHQTCFSELVFSFAGFKEHSDALFQFYFKLLESHSDLEMDNEKLIRQALKVYMELMVEKRRLRKEKAFLIAYLSSGHR